MSKNRNIERLTSFGALAALGGAASGAAWGAVPLGAVLALAVVGVGWVGVRLRLGGALPSASRLSRRRGIRVAGALLGVGLLVGASVTGSLGAPGAVGTASAATTAQCNDDAFVDAFWSTITGGLSTDYTAECVETVEDLNTEDNQTALDIYSAASTNAQVWESTRRVRMNYLQDMGTIAYSEGQAAAWAAWKNKTDVNGDGNFSQTDMALAGERAAENYTAHKERNFLKRWESQVISAGELSARAQNESGVSNFTVIAQYVDSGGTNHNYPSQSKTTVSVQLVNGTSMNLSAFEWSQGNGETATLRPTELTVLNSGSTTTHDGWVWVRDIDTNPAFTYLNTTKSSEVLDEFDAVSNKSSNNVAKWVNGSFDELQNGTLNASEALDASTIARQFGMDADAENGSGYYAQAVASLSSAGLETPNLNETASMTISVNRTYWLNGTQYTGTREYVGLLMSQNAPPSGSWKNGTTYDPAAVNGSQLMASQEFSIFELENNFTVTSIQNKEGDALNNTSVKKYSYQAVTNDEYIALQENLTDLRMAMEDYQATRDGGGGSGLGSVPPWAVVGGLVVAVGGLAYAMRGNNGGGRGAA